MSAHGSQKRPHEHDGSEPQAKRMKLATPIREGVSIVRGADGVEVLYLDGKSLSTGDLVHASLGQTRIQVTSEAWEAVRAARGVVDRLLERKTVTYGINTGFGNFATTVIPADKLAELQENLIRSHASGIGEPLTPERTRMLMILRVNVLAKGYSGIRPETLQKFVEAFNASCLPWVPEKGTVGASGDLAPLSHLALGLMGEGLMWTAEGYKPALEVLTSKGLTPIKLEAKEGLALINGTQLITALTAEALERAKLIARQANVVAAMTVDVLMGTHNAFDRDAHLARPHDGQLLVASDMRTLLHNDKHPSAVYLSHENCDRVQDAYSQRCIPQVHGVAFDTLAFVEKILTTEMNSATDNPMVLASRDVILSAGNFHGEYPAKAADYLAIGIHEIANISERRIERLVNHSLNGVHPPFLVAEGGLNSGFMIAHCAAASLVSENKVLCHPASVDSISTSAGKEDHVSMGGFAARKAITVVEHVEQVVAIEMLCACQALEFLRPLKSTEAIEAVHHLVREHVAAWSKDRYMAPDIAAAHQLLRSGAVWSTVADYMSLYQRE